MRPDDLKKGVRVRFVEESGLDPDREYIIFTKDLTAWSVRLEGEMGSYSIDHIAGINLSPSIPNDQTGMLEDAAQPSNVAEIPKKLPSVETGLHEVSNDAAVMRIVGTLEGMDAPDLLDAMESHLLELCKHPDPSVKYHARSALQIQWYLEGGGGSEAPEDSGDAQVKTEDQQAQ